MKWFLKAAVFSALLTLPGHWIAPAYQSLLLGVTSILLGRELVAPANGPVDLSAANLLTVFIALCLASDFASWRQRWKAIARGIPLLVAVEVACGVVGMSVGGGAVVPTAPWQGMLAQMPELSRWLAVPLAWAWLLGRLALPQTRPEHPQEAPKPV
jgi:Na+/glutamate symporter